MRLMIGIALGVALTADPAARAQAPAADAAPAPNDYRDDKSWLCRPGRQDACSVDLTTTVVHASGKLTREAWARSSNPPIDCFYVYPTISTDPTENSDMTPDPAELNVIRTQFARFGSQCRLYAPMYRQVTLGGLRRVLAAPDGPTSLTRGVAYDDVRDAWRHYVEHDNKRRGFVLIGHSQGSFVLSEIIKNGIDGKPILARMVSAFLLGATISVPKGQDAGGSFQRVPLCSAPTQIGCIITFASYQATIPPQANTLFGRVAAEGQVAARTNPAALSGGSGQLRAYFSTTGQTVVGRQSPRPWVTPEKAIATPWVSAPGLLTARCASNEHASGYLAVDVHGDPADPRVDDIYGDLGTAAQIQAGWGLHLVDVELAIGNLVDLVGRQVKSFASKKRGRRR